MDSIVFCNTAETVGRGYTDAANCKFLQHAALLSVKLTVSPTGRTVDSVTLIAREILPGTVLQSNLSPAPRLDWAPR